MPISDTLHKFNDENISISPTNKGVYALYVGDVTIYIGKAEGVNGIRERLQAHKRGDEGTCTQEASTYSREPCEAPTLRETELLKEYQQRSHGRLPRCNERIG